MKTYIGIIILSVAVVNILFCLTNSNENILMVPMAGILSLLGIIALIINEDK